MECESHAFDMGCESPAFDMECESHAFDLECESHAFAKFGLPNALKHGFSTPKTC